MILGVFLFLLHAILPKFVNIVVHDSHTTASTNQIAKNVIVTLKFILNIDSKILS